MQHAQVLDLACSTAALRGVNLLFSGACFHLLYLIHQELHGAVAGGAGDKRPGQRQNDTPSAVVSHAAAPSPLTRRASAGANQSNGAEETGEQEASGRGSQSAAAIGCPRHVSLLTALTLSLLPTHHFFTFLYYTDVGAAVCVLLTYLLLLRQRHAAAAAAGFAAVAFRQTSVVWVAFLTAASMLKDVQASLGASNGRGRPGGDGSNSAAMPSAWHPEQQGNGPCSADQLPVPISNGHEGSSGQLSFAAEVRLLVRQAWRLRWQLLRRFGPLLAIPAAFIGFVAVNGGIAVGDRAAHRPVAHVMQLLYFALFTAGALVAWIAPGLGGALRATRAAARARPARAMAVAVAVRGTLAGAVRQFTVVHPYLLADNRHYTFYIWRKVFARHWAARYALVPAYALSFFALHRQLSAVQGRLWAAGFWAAAAAALVPAGLVEFRYFTAPLLLAALAMPPPRKAALGVTALAFAAVNAATLYLFACRPFTWPDGSTARFMW